MALADLAPGRSRLRFGLTPYLEPVEMRRAWQPVTAYLRRVLGVPVDLVVARSYEDLIDQTISGRLDIVSISPLSYVEASDRAPGLKLVATEISGGSPTFSSLVIVRADDPAQTLADLKGYRARFVDVHSTSGFLMPKGALMASGIDIDRDLVFPGPRFSGSHTAVVAALAAGEIDVTAVASGMLATAARERGIDVGGLRILANAGRLPLDALCVYGAIPAAGRAKIAAAFLRLDTRTKEGRAVLGPSGRLSGWIPAVDSDYDAVRALRDRVQGDTH